MPLRRAGELLREMDKNKGAATPPTLYQPGTALPPTLEDIGIDRHDSSRWQTIAALPATQFEEYSDTVGSPMYSERLDAAKDATRKYYRVLEKLEKIRKESIGR
jgi:hypothetical protein